MALLVLLLVASAVQFIPSAQAVWNEQDYVDNNTSDVGAPTDRGTHSNFDAEKAGPDSTYDTLTEENIIAGAGSQWLDCNAFSSTGNQWTLIGSSPYLNAQDQPTNIIETKTDGYRTGWFNFPDTTLQGTITANISIYCQNDDGAGDDWADVIVDYTGSGSGSDVGNVGQHTAWQYDTISLGTHTASEINNLRVNFTYRKFTGADEVRIDHVRIGVSSSGTTSYELDLEVQWTNVNYTKEYEYLCIYAGSTGSENILVDVWTGAGWQNVIADLNANAWNNVSVATWLTGSTFTMRYKGGTETGDSSQDTWQIDCALLHTWIDQIDNVEAGGPYNVGETISVTWSNYDEFGSGENYINVEYIDQDLSQQIALHSLAKTATSDTYGPIGSAQAGHTIQVWVYTASGATDNHNSAITKGNPWPETCTVNSGAAEFPHGASLLLLLVPVAYLIIRRRSASHTMPRTDRRVMR